MCFGSLQNCFLTRKNNQKQPKFERLQSNPGEVKKVALFGGFFYFFLDLILVDIGAQMALFSWLFSKIQDLEEHTFHSNLKLNLRPRELV